MDAQDYFTSEEINEINNLRRLAKHYMDKTVHAHNLTYESYLVLAGGVFYSWLHGQPPKDCDIFVLNPGLAYGSDPVKNEIQAALSATIKSSDLQINENSEYIKNPNIIEVWLDKNTKNQFIFTNYKTRGELVKHFDFEHCKVSYGSATGKLYISPLTYYCMKNKILLKNPTGLEAMQWRIDKFKLKGFDISKVTPGAPDPWSHIGTIRPAGAPLNPIKSSSSFPVHVKQYAKTAWDQAVKELEELEQVIDSTSNE